MTNTPDEVIRSRDNARIKLWHELAHSARERRARGLTVLDGVHLIESAQAAGLDFETLVVGQGAGAHAENARLLGRLRREPVQVSDALLRHISPVDHPSGILAILRWPQTPAWEAARCRDSVVLVEGVQDAGNLGTILRTAAAAGIREVLLSPGCVHAWAPRVLRAGMGAHFCLAIHEGMDLGTALEGYRGKLAATSLGPGSIDLYEAGLDGQIAWAFGAEGQGLSDALLAQADLKLRIPMAPGIESLNVAASAAVCLFEQRRQQRQ